LCQTIEPKEIKNIASWRVGRPAHTNRFPPHFFNKLSRTDQLLRTSLKLRRNPPNLAGYTSHPYL